MCWSKISFHSAYESHHFVVHSCAADHSSDGVSQPPTRPLEKLKAPKKPGEGVMKWPRVSNVLQVVIYNPCNWDWGETEHQRLLIDLIQMYSVNEAWLLLLHDCAIYLGWIIYILFALLHAFKRIWAVWYGFNFCTITCEFKIEQQSGTTVACLQDIRSKLCELTHIWVSVERVAFQHLVCLFPSVAPGQINCIAVQEGQVLGNKEDQECKAEAGDSGTAWNSEKTCLKVCKAQMQSMF